MNVLVLLAPPQNVSAVHDVAAKAATAATVLHAQGYSLVFSGWMADVPRHWHHREVPFVPLRGSLRADIPFSHILVFGEVNDSLAATLKDFKQSLNCLVFENCQSRDVVELIDHVNTESNLTFDSSKPADALPTTTQVYSDQRDVVVFWKQNDTGLYGRRSDMLVQYLLTRDDVRRVLVFDAPIQPQNFLANPGDNWFNQARHIYVRTLQRMLDTTPSPEFSASADKLRLRTGVYDKAFDGFQFYQQFITSELTDFDIDPSQALFILYPRVRGGERILQHFKPWRAVADVVDDQRAWPALSEKRLTMLTAHYRDILGSCEQVITNCLPVKVSMLEFHDRIKVIPNGCDVEPPVTQSWLNAEILSELRAFNGPVLAYVGNLESKIDIPLLEKVAAAYPDALVLLIGSTHANTDVLALKRFSNVRFTGVLPYAEANAVLKFVDVGLVPHLTTELTINMNPLKVFVYLSHHIPVVATTIPNLVTHAYVRQNTSHESFLAAIAETLETKSSFTPDVFRRFVHENRWEKRFAAWFDQVLHKGVSLYER